MSKFLKDENFVVVHGWMINRYKLKGNELMIYAIIYGFSQAENTKFTGSLSYLAEFAGVSKKTAQNVLKSLCNKELIIKHEQSIKGIKLCDYVATFPPMENFTTPPPKKPENTDGQDLPPHGKTYHTPMVKLTTNNIEYNKEENKIKEGREKNPTLLFFENLFKEKFKSEFSYKGKYNETYQTNAIEFIKENKGAKTEQFLKQCFKLDDRFFIENLSPHLILKHLNTFTAAIQNNLKPAAANSINKPEKIKISRTYYLQDYEYKNAIKAGAIKPADYVKIKYNNEVVYCKKDRVPESIEIINN